MAARMVVNVVVGVALFASASPFVSVARAQGSCTQEINRQDAALRQFGGEAQREGFGFAADDVGRIALVKMKANLKGDPTADAYEGFKQEWDKYNGWIEKGKKFQAILDRMSQCLKQSKSGCLNEVMEYNMTADQLLNKSHDAMNKWIESLGNDNITRAAERVERAKGVMEKLTSNAGNLATGAVSGAMNNCLRDFNQRVQQVQSSDPVDLSQAAGQAAQPPRPGNTGGRSGGASGGSGAASGGGAGMGTALGVGSAIAAGSVGAYYIGQELNKAKCDSYELEAQNKSNALINAANNVLACTTTSCINSREPAAKSAASSFFTSLGSWCNCLGTQSDLSASDKAYFRELIYDLQSYGISTGSLPSCFR